MELTVTKNATCTFCGCVCDDIELHSDGERITHTKAACVLGVSWFKNHTPMSRFGEAEELVGAAIYLASPAASFVTGHTLAVDGGYLACGVPSDPPAESV